MGQVIITEAEIMLYGTVKLGTTAPNTAFSGSLPVKEPIIRDKRYGLFLAHGYRDLAEAQELRFRVFNLELGEGLSESYLTGRDEDLYDHQCDHLLVRELETGSVIGTYRLQTLETAENGYGFYTANEFDIRQIPSHHLKNSVELGRACIAREHRNGRVLYLLWRGIVKFMRLKSKNVLFGCCSITSQDQKEAWLVYEYTRRIGVVREDFSVVPLPSFSCLLHTSLAGADALEVSLPVLFQKYIDFGATVCSPPAIDREFKTIDYLVFLNLDEMDQRMLAFFDR